jgi:DNA-binding NarL/FixJ family response regulator
MIQSDPPNLFICDIMMPVLDGWGVLEQFPKATRTFLVVMLTNLEDEDTRKRCKQMEVDAFLIKKDMSLHTLVELAEKLLQKA